MYLNALSTSSLSGKYICWLLKVLVHYIGLLKHGTDIIYLKKKKDVTVKDVTRAKHYECTC